MNGRPAVLAVLAVVVVAGLASAGAGGEPVASSGTAVQGEAVEFVQFQENNTTRHENPEDVNEGGNLGDVRRWLEGRMGDRLEDSAVQLEQGEYEKARGAVGDDYRDLLGKYVDVAGETRGEGETADQFERARETQRDLVDDVQAYRETREEYREAKANGNEQRARRLAREMDRQAEAIQRNGTKLNRTYEQIGNATSLDTDREQQAIANVTENVTEQQQAVENETFVSTSLAASVEDREVSFTDPLVVTGQVTAANGTPVADARVVLAVGDRQVEVRTDEDGRFSLTYRPTTAAVGEQNVSVQFLPQDASVYLGSETTVDVVVGQVTPTLSVDSQTDAVSFDDQLPVSGEVGVDGNGASGVPVAVYLGGTLVAEGLTDGDGSFTLEGSVPKDVPAGEQDLRVLVPLENQSLAGVEETSTVSVARSDTELAIEEATVDGGSLSVAGGLRTEAGVPVPEGRVRVTLGGTVLSTVRTDADGNFQATLDVPTGLRPNGEPQDSTLRASFEGTGTNLGGSEATTSVRLMPVGNRGNDGSVLPLSSLSMVALGAGVLLLAAGGAVVYRRRGQVPVEGPDESGSEPVPEPSPAGGGLNVDGLTSSRQHLEAGRPDLATETAYELARRRLAESLDVPASSTHWEFLTAVDQLEPEGVDLVALESLTETYEMATFAPVGVPEDAAEEAVDIAESFTQ